MESKELNQIVNEDYSKSEMHNQLYYIAEEIGDIHFDALCEEDGLSEDEIDKIVEFLEQVGDDVFEILEQLNEFLRALGKDEQYEFDYYIDN